MTDIVRDALERAKRFIDACADEGELTPNDAAENPCEVSEAIELALAAQPSAGAQVWIKPEHLSRLADPGDAMDGAMVWSEQLRHDFLPLRALYCPSAGAQVRGDLTEAQALSWFDKTGMTPREIVAALATPAQPDTGAVEALREALEPFIAAMKNIRPDDADMTQICLANVGDYRRLASCYAALSTANTQGGADA